MQDITKIFDEKTIEYYKSHKEEITQELLTQLRKHGNVGRQIALDILDTDRDEDYYYVDAFDTRISFNGDRELKKSYTKMILSDIHISELKKCAEDLDYFKNNYIKIRTKDGINFPEMRPYQDGFLKVLNSDYESIVSLQPRQSGKSISTGIYLTWKFVFDHDKIIGICANETSLACEFLKNIKNMFYNLPMWMKVGVGVWNTTQIESENKMRILTDKASADAFRGFTISILVVDETAFIDPSCYYAFIDSVAPAQSALAWKKNIFISTANGMNHFYDLVKGARNRKTIVLNSEDALLEIQKTRKVLDVKKRSDTDITVTLDEPSNDYILYQVDWKDVPRFNAKGEKLSPDVFREQVETKFGKVYFNQNYACEFLGSSYTLINADTLKKFSSLEYKEKIDGKLKVYEYPKENHKYIMGVDTSKGGIDSTSIQVIDITNMPFRQVASAKLLINYQLAPDFIYEYAMYYNKAFLIIENNEGSGTFCANMLDMEYEYENLYYKKGSRIQEPGFSTNKKTRNQILDSLKMFAEADKLIICDKDTLSELYTFIIKGNKYQADSGCHDDCVMSLALCFVPFIDIENFVDMREVINKIYSENTSDFDITKYMVVGNFDDYSEDQGNKLRPYDEESFVV